MYKDSYDVLLVGAGPVGLFAANVFGQKGLKVLLIEQYPSKIRYPRAIGIDSEVLRTIQSVGLFEEFEPSIRPLKRFQLIHGDNKVLIDTSFTSKGCTEEGTYLFYQPELETILENGIKRFPKVEVKYENQLIDIEETGASQPVRCSIKDKNGNKQTVEAKFLIGCDGANSQVKKLMNFKEKSLNYEGYILKIDAEVASIKALSFNTEIAQKYASLDRPWVRMLGRRNHCRWEFQIKEKDATDDLLGDKVALEHIARTGEDIGNITILNSALYKFRSAYNKDWQKDCVFVAGDAAHVTSPYIGQGMCAGFRDIANLSWKIKEVLDRKSDQTILETYKTERIPNVRTFIRLAILLGLLFKTRLYYLVICLIKIPFLKKLFTSTDVGQPNAGPGYFAKDKLARKLFPQTEIVLNGNQKLKSDNWLNGQWTLLSTSKITDNCNEKAKEYGINTKTITQAIDKNNVLIEWMTKNGTTSILIRPDRYVFASGKDPKKILNTYLQFRKSA